MATTQELITKAKTFDPTEVSYKPVRVNSKGGKSIPLSLNGNNVVLQFPLMFTWGLMNGIATTVLLRNMI